jgi:hypothetical protein
MGRMSFTIRFTFGLTLLLGMELLVWSMSPIGPLRCLGFSGQSNSLFFKEKEGPSDGSQQEKGTCQRASHFLG